MKAYLDANGTIHVQAETQLEAYALSRWAKENFNPQNRVFNADGLEVIWGVRESPEPAQA
jgi:hypothetical protein